MPAPASVRDPAASARTPGAAPAPALRAARRRPLRDPRLALGAALIVLAGGIGAWGWSNGQRTVPVWAVVGGLSAGATVEGDDLLVKQVGAEVAEAYVGADAVVVGQVLTRDLGGGELIPAAALGDASASDLREVTVPVEAARAPMGLARGARVDVYATADRGSTALVLADATVGAVQEDGARFGGVGRTWSVVLVVPADRAAQLVAGARRGQLDLVERAR